MSEEQEPYDEDPPENESKGIYSSYIYHEPQSIKEIDNEIKAKIEALIGEVHDISDDMDTANLPHIDPQLAEKLQQPILGNLFSRDTEADFDQLEPIVDIPDGFTINKQIPEDYIRRFYDQEIAQQNPQEFLFGDNPYFSAASFPTDDKVSVTAKVRKQAEEIQSLFASTATVEEIADIFDLFEKMRKTIDDNDDIFKFSPQVIKPWFEDHLRQDVTDIRKISEEVNKFIEGYEEMAKRYITARFKLHEDENPSSFLSSYAQVQSNVEYMEIELEKMVKRKYIEKLQQYQDRHILKGRKTEPKEFLPLDRDAMEEEYNKILEEEIKFATRLFQLDKVKVKGYHDDPDREYTVDELLRAIPQEKLQDLTSDERMNSEFRSAGYVQERAVDAGVAFDFGSDRYVVFDTAAKDASKSELPRPHKMFIDTTVSVAAIRQTVRHELVHAINNLMSEGNTYLEGMRARIINGGSSMGLSSYLTELVKTFASVALRIEDMMKNIDNEIYSPSRIQESFDRAFKISAMDADKRKEFIEKMRDVVRYLKNFLDSTKGIEKKIKDTHFAGNKHGREMIEQLRLSEGAASSPVKEPFSRTEPSIRDKFGTHTGRPDIRQHGDYSLRSLGQTAVEKLMDLDDSTSTFQYMSEKRTFMEFFIYPNTFAEDVDIADTMEEAMQNPDVLEYMRKNRYNIADIRAMLDGDQPQQEAEEPQIDTEDEHEESVDDQTAIVAPPSQPAPAPSGPPPGGDPPIIPTPPSAPEPDDEPRVTTSVIDRFTVHRPTPLSISLSRRVILLHEIDLPKLFNFHERMEKMLSTKVCIN